MNTFEFSEQNSKVRWLQLWQNIISNPTLKKRDTVTPKPNDITRIISIKIKAFAILLLYLLDTLTSLYQYIKRTTGPILLILRGALIGEGRLLERSAYFKNLTFWSGALQRRALIREYFSLLFSTLLVKIGTPPFVMGKGYPPPPPEIEKYTCLSILLATFNYRVRGTWVPTRAFHARLARC